MAIKQFCSEELPDKIGITMACVREDNNEQRGDLVNVVRFSSYNMVLKVLARVISAIKEKSFRAIGDRPKSDRLKEAEMWLIRNEQKGLQKDWRSAYQRLGPVMNEEGIILVGERISRWLKENWNQDCFVLMPPDSYLMRLYIQDLHNIDHGGVECTLAKLQGSFWVPRARRLIKKVKGKCVVCRKLNKVIVGQNMGQIISERLKPAPPFYHTSLDLFGPFAIRDTVKRRSFGKAYGVISNCLVTRAVYIDLADGYDTKSFLTVFKRFVSIRGYPKTIRSDWGTQLLAASKELKVLMRKWEESTIAMAGVDKGTTWIFNKSADAPWQNGCSEALIRSVKRAIAIAIGDSKLTFGEFQTVLFEVANLLNERPIGMKPGGDVELGSYLCPNELLLGRASVKVPGGNHSN